MNFNNINRDLQTDDLVLRVINESYRGFIANLFQDHKIRKYYIVPKEARQDYKNLIDYWLNDVKNGAGTCWIIYKDASGPLSFDKACGFIAFEFRDSLKNARISYALRPEYRGKAVMSKAATLVIDNLKENGIERIEADIDRDNFESEKVVEKLGFTADKRSALVDPEMLRDGEIRMRALWKKQLYEISDNFKSHVRLNASIEEIVGAINRTVDEINTNGQKPLLVAHYFYLFGRIKFLEQKYEEARDAFGNCNMVNHKEGLQENYETYYWFGRINEATGDKKSAMMYYESALEKYYDNPYLATRQEILNALDI